MLAERQKIPSSSEIDKRKAHMRKAVFSSDSVVPPQPTSLERKRGTLLPNESGGVYSESDVSRLVNARRKRNEAARFRERQTSTVARLNHGQARTRYEHEVYNARDSYAALLVARSRELHATPDLQAALLKVERTETWQRADNDAFESDLDALARRLLEARSEQLPTAASGETEDCRVARKLYRETNQKLIDFRKNALEVRIKRDAEAPSRTSTLLSINEAKKHENALADMAYGEKKLRDVQNQDEDDEPSVFQRRATKPMLLWTTTKPADKLISDFETMKQPENVFGPPELIDAKLMAERANPDEDSKATKTNKQTQRHRSGMSLQEYLERAKAQH